MALLRIREALLNLPRTKIVSIDDRYLHATQTSRLLHYTDDIEFLVDEHSQQIQARSCARVGYYDFGVNRQRIEQIRATISAD